MFETNIHKSTHFRTLILIVIEIQNWWQNSLWFIYLFSDLWTKWLSIIFSSLAVSASG